MPVLLLMLLFLIAAVVVRLAHEVSGDRPVHPPRSHAHEGPSPLER